MSDPQPKPSINEEQNAAFLNSPLVAEIVGRNVAFYRRKWSKILDKAGGPDENVLAESSWNWPAFLFTAGWLVYRKLYLYGAICLALEIGFGFITTKVPIGLIMSIVVGMFGNSLYLYKVAGMVKRAEALPSQVDRDRYVIRQGGTNVVYGVGVMVAAFAVMAFFTFGSLAFDGAGDADEASFDVGQMPVCDSRVVRQLLTQTLEDSPAAKQGLKVLKLGALDDYNPWTAGEPVKPNPPTRTCMAEVFSNRGRLLVTTVLSWTDAKEDELYLEITDGLTL